jgi:hypothetical protein
MILTRVNRRTRRKPVPVPLCPSQIPHGMARVRTLCLSGERPVTNCLSHGMALHRLLVASCSPWRPEISGICGEHGGTAPYHGSGGLSPACHGGVPGSRPGQSMWDLWWTKWHWDRFFSELFGFPLSISLLRPSPYSYIIQGMNKTSVRAAVQRRSLVP